jgi:hypothetical protein
MYDLHRRLLARLPIALPLCQFLNSTSFANRQHRSALNRFTQSAIKIMNSYDHIISIKTKEKFLTENIELRRLHYYNATVRHGVLPDSSPIERKELIQMKSLTSDAAEGYVIIAWHPKFCTSSWTKIIELWYPKFERRTHCSSSFQLNIFAKLSKLKWTIFCDVSGSSTMLST